MEERKLLKRKQKAENGANRKQIAEACFILGDFYHLKHKYEKALKEYKECAYIYKKMGVSVDTAKAHRMVGEMYMLLGEFSKALQYDETYLSLAKQLNNKIEEQRAYATLGRAYLLQGQSSSDDKSSECFKQAEKAFSKSLCVCESLKGKISNLEFMDMRARLLLNIGVVLEQLGSFDKAIEFIQKAINISKCHDFYELLHQCYLTEGTMYLSKTQDFSNALMCFNFALDVASRLENKASKQSEALSLKAELLCKMSDFHSAKQALLKAWKMKTSDENEFREIEKKLKIVAAMCYTEDLIITTDSTEYGTLKNLYERLGDGACSLKNYKKGVDYYLKMLENAEKYGDSGKKLTPIYVSLYQTYIDMEDYENALKFYEKELDLIKDNPSEACATNIGIADVLQKAGRTTLEVEFAYQKALLEAQKTDDEKLQKKTVKLLLKFYNQYKPFEVESFEKKYESLLSHASQDSSSDDEDGKTDFSQNTPDIGDEICIENLTDVSEIDDDEENCKPNVTRKRGKGFTIKKNSKGETQLHQACISGNSLLVTRLISQGHPVNVRDNAGWLPLHEACIHGHKEIVETLLQNNARVNDRGGVQCDGITPMHDAAGNGHLEIVDLLLENGASSSIKSDQGETVLDTLKHWRKNTKLSTVEEIFYDTLCSKLHKNLDKIVQISPKEPLVDSEKKRNTQKFNRKKSASPLKLNNLRRVADHSDLDSDSSDNVDRHVSKRKAIISDGSSDDSNVVVKPNSKTKKTGVSEYRNAISALRNRNTAPLDTHLDIVKEKRKKGAILNPEEVGEDWLDDDLKEFQNKKLKKSYDSPVKRKSNESNKSREKSPIITPKKSTNIDDLHIRLPSQPALVSSNLFDSDNDFSDDILTSHSYRNSPQKTNEALLDSHNVKFNKKSRKWKYQTSLIKSGFTRQKSSQQPAHSTWFEDYNSDSENVTNMSECSYSSNKNKPTEEPDSTSESIVLNTSNNSVTRTSVMDGILAPISVRVKILDKILLIPLAADKLSSLTVNWLINEASKRYYKLEGVKPVFSLLTSDGAILTEDDPLNIVINSGELHASITNWNLPPLIERYVECCSQLKSDIDSDIKNVIESADSTNVLTLSDLNLGPPRFHPIFKSLYHQSTLTHLYLDNNLLENEGMVYLSSCLPTLKGLSHINLKNNYIQSNGLKHLYDAYQKQSEGTLSQHLSLDLSYNPIDSTGFIYVLKLSRRISFSKLYLKACDLREDIPRGIFEMANFKRLEVLDIGLNDFTNSNIVCLLSTIDPEKIISLDLEGTKLSNSEAMQSLVQSSFVNLKSINLSRCNLIDSDIYQLLRMLLECDNLNDVSLCYNEELSFLSLKRLITHRPSITNIKLVGCPNIFTHMSDLDVEINWFTLTENCNLCSLSLSVDLCIENVRNKYEALKKMWLGCDERNKIIKKYDSVVFQTTVCK